jgi:hypothetical protein
MSPITENGFLGKEMRSYISDIRSEYSGLFNLCDEINKLCHKTLFEIDAHSREAQEILTATLYMRIKSSFQGVVILAERGMIPQAKMILRSILEAMFTLCALSKNVELCDFYIQADQKKRLKQLYKLRMLKSGLPSASKETELQSLEQELKKDIEEKGIKLLNVEQWAKEAGLHDIYLSVYTVLCDPVHTNVRDLERYLVLDENNEIKEFNWGPDTDYLEIVLSANIEFMLVALKATCDLFAIDKEKTINNLHDKLKVLINDRRKSDN